MKKLILPVMLLILLAACQNQTENHSNDQQEDGCNACSPFLTCGTCSGFIFSNLGVDLKEIFIYNDKFVTFYKFQFADDFFANIWQPPKIS